MKFICTVLILAGVFAVNDALHSFAEQKMRIARDKLKIKNLMQINTRDESSRKCGQDYLDALKQALDKYDAARDDCNATASNAIEVAEQNARVSISAIGDDIGAQCDALGKCATEEDPEKILECLKTQADLSSKALSGVSNDASKANLEMQTAIVTATSTRKLCDESAYVEYAKESDNAETAWNNCRKNPPAPASTQAP